MGPEGRRRESSGYFKGSSLPPAVQAEGLARPLSLSVTDPRHWEMCVLSFPTHFLPPLLGGREAGAWVRAQLCCSLPAPAHRPPLGGSLPTSVTAAMPDPVPPQWVSIIETAHACPLSEEAEPQTNERRVMKFLRLIFCLLVWVFKPRSSEMIILGSQVLRRKSSRSFSWSEKA